MRNVAYVQGGDPDASCQETLEVVMCVDWRSAVRRSDNVDRSGQEDGGMEGGNAIPKGGVGQPKVASFTEMTGESHGGSELARVEVGRFATFTSHELECEAFFFQFLKRKALVCALAGARPQGSGVSMQVEFDLPVGVDPPRFPFIQFLSKKNVDFVGR